MIEHPVHELHPKDPRPAPAVLLGPVLFEEHAAKSAHVVALYHLSVAPRRRRNGEGDLLLHRRRRGRGRRLARLLRRRGLARRHLARPLRRRGRQPPPPQAVRQVRPEDDLVHPGPLDRDVPGGDEADRRRGARDRHARLLAREPDLDDAGAGGGRPDQVHRPDRGRLRPPADRLRRAVVGVLERHERAAAQARDQVRPQPDAQGLPPVLRPRRRHVDEDRLLEAAGGVDEAARPRPGDRPDRDPGELVPRRPAADDVHQGRAQQPRLRQPAAPRGDLARPVRLHLPRGGVRGLRR